MHRRDKPHSLVFELRQQRGHVGVAGRGPPASFGYLDPALRVAQRYPEVKFVHPGGYKRAANLTTYWASTPEAFYLMGMAAGKVTKTNKIGYVVALPISFFLANVNAFELGARSVNPAVETRVVFTGTFLDPAKEATAAAALLDQGADVLGAIVDSPITVVQTAEKRGAYSVGYHYIGAQKFAPKGWISGIAFTWGNLYTRFARQVMDGTWKSENILGSLSDDYFTLAPFGPAVSAEAVTLVNARKQDFIAGRAHPFRGPLKDNTGVERVKAGEVFPLTDLGKMNWLVEGVIGQARWGGEPSFRSGDACGLRGAWELAPPARGARRHSPSSSRAVARARTSRRTGPHRSVGGSRAR